MDRTKRTDAPPSFEDAYERLESIVDSLESGETPLAELVTRYEEGMKCLKICREHLEDAELRIERLDKSAGNIKVEPFELKVSE